MQKGYSSSYCFILFLDIWVFFPPFWFLGDVIYNAMYPLAAPDVIFGPEDENFRPYNGVSEEKSSRNVLTDWDSRDPKRLLCLLLELR